MSNGIGKNPLNDISKVYLEQVAKKKKKKDDSYLETDMKKRQANNEKARKDMEKMGTKMKNPHFEQKQFGWDSVNSMTKAYRAMQEGVRDEDPEKGTAERKARLEKKRGMKLDDHPQYKKEEVEQFDENRAAMGRINKEYHRKKEADEMAARARDPKVKRDLPKRKNDNPMYDAKSAGISRAKGFKFTPVKEESEQIDEIIDPKGAARIDAAKKKKKVDVFAYDRKLQAQGKLKGKKLPPAPTNEALDPVGKEDGDVNNDGKKDSTDSYLMKRRKAIGSAMKKRLKEERASLSEVMTDKEEDKKVTEKKVDNKIVINPKLSEAVEEIGGEVLEMVEVEEMMEPQTDEEKKKDTEISSKERRLQQVKKQIAMKKLQAIRQGDKNVMSSHEPEGDMIDERTRYAKETGKDFTTGKPSERGGTRPGNTFDKVKSELRKTGGVMSDRGKAIQPQGKKKVPGKKGYQGTTPVDRIRNRLAQQRAAKPNPYKARAGESD